jgi:hypothetical protein
MVTGQGVVSIVDNDRESTYFVIVPSISDMTTISFESHTKIRAVQAITPVVDNENVMVFAPGFKLSAF